MNYYNLCNLCGLKKNKYAQCVCKSAGYVPYVPPRFVNGFLQMDLTDNAERSMRDLRKLLRSGL